MIGHCPSCLVLRQCSEVVTQSNVGCARPKWIAVACRTCGRHWTVYPPQRAFALDVPSWIWLASAFTAGATAGTWLTFWAIS